MSRRAACALALAVLLVALWVSPAAAQSPPPEAPRLVLLFPNAPGGTTLATPRPRFVWSSTPVEEPPGPWRYDLEIVNAGTGERIIVRQLVDTTFTPSADLESNTSYRWTVTARLTTGDSVRVASVASFVIVAADAPPGTLLYQNFPNPFPAGGVQTTCIWFDLRIATRVQLDVYDIRGNQVRTLVPSQAVSGELPAGRYGRANGSALTGCDERFAWDGRADGGREVPPGVYLVRLRAGGVSTHRKILYRGR